MSSFIPESSFAVDTMAVVLHLEKRRISQRVKVILNATLRGESTIFLPGTVFAKILYLSEKKRITATLADVLHLLAQNPLFQEIPLTFAVVSAASEITDIPELHDRLIAGTARSLGIPLITNDPRIQASRFVQTVW